ncbi:hypothetical protein QJQ45_016178, partial [Haematococcus lacustris]
TLWCQDPVVWYQEPVVRFQDPVGQDPVVRCQDPVGQDLVVCARTLWTLWCQDPVVWFQDPVGQDPVRLLKPSVPPQPARHFQPNEMRTARRPLEATGTLVYISHAISLQTGGSAATRATVGSITVHTGNIRGQTYDYMPYAGATSAAATSSRRRMDPSLGPLGLNLASGLHGEDTTHMQYLGNVTRAELQPRAPRYIEVPQLKRGNQAAVSAIIAKQLEKQGTPAIDGVSCTVNKITIDNIDMYMATYGVRVAAKDVPAILTAHETDPVIVDIHSGLKVEEGRMRCITSEAGAAMGSHTTRAYVQIHAMPSLFSCDSNSKVITPSSPSRLAEIRQVIHSAA